MKIALFGATGMIGRRILHEALERGHVVVALSRDPSTLPDQPRLSKQAVDASKPAAVFHAVQGVDAVISAMGPSRTADAPSDGLSALATCLIDGLHQAGVKRLLIVGGAGSLEVEPGVQLMDAPDFPAAWKGIASEHRRALEVYRREQALDWTYFSPAALIEPGERTGHYRRGGDQLLVSADGKSRIGAEDFAVAILDELEKPQANRQRIAIAY